VDTGKPRCRADASGTLQCSRFGMRAILPFVGDEVRLRIRAEATLKH
jgi:polyisoprenoid-binding protein YceI